MPFNRDEVAGARGQAEADAAFDQLLAQSRAFRDAAGIDTLPWPQGVPEPSEDNQFSNAQDKAAYDLLCTAGAYIFLHEIQHVRFEKEGNKPADPRVEEFACDRFAQRFLLDKVDVKQSDESGENIRAKRALGIVVAIVLILEVTPAESWAGSNMHPPVSARVKCFLENLQEPMTEWFWISLASFLAAMCRSRGRLPAQISFSSARELAWRLTHCL
jgi:hypothetical protein